MLLANLKKGERFEYNGDYFVVTEMQPLDGQVLCCCYNDTDCSRYESGQIVFLSPEKLVEKQY